MFNKALIIGILLVGATFSVSANEVQKWEYKCMEVSDRLAYKWGSQCKRRGTCKDGKGVTGLEDTFKWLGEKLAMKSITSHRSLYMLVFWRTP